MNDDSSSGGVGAWLGIVVVLLLFVGGAGFYLITTRHEQALAAAAEETLLAEERTRAARVAAVTQEKRAKSAAEQARRVVLDTQRTAANRQSRREEVEEENCAAVESVLRAQQEAWNRGDVDAFVVHYWKSDDVTFSSGGKTTRGWEETVRGYWERYPTREAMGELEFANLEITPLGDGAALVLGEWRLARESEPLSGNFSLVFRKLDGRWVIVHDHTSRVE